MRKIVILLTVLMLGAGGIAKADGTANKIISLANQYKHNDEFEVVKIGPLFMKLIKMTTKEATDVDDEDTWAMLDGVKKMVVVEYDDAAAGVREEFNEKARKILSKCDVLMEAKDGDDIVRIYGDISSEGDKVSDLVIFVPTDGALICIAGTVAMSEVQSIMNGAKNFRD